MPYQDKKTKLWVGRVRLTGQPARVKKGFPKKSDAKLWELTERKSAKKEETRDYSIYEMADAWLVACKQRNKAKTCEDKSYPIKKFLKFIGPDTPPGEISPIDIEEFLNSVPGRIIEGCKTRSTSGKTANRYKRELTHLFNYIKKRGVIHSNPVNVIDRYKEAPYRRYVPPAEDIQAILNIAEGMERNFIIFAYNTLARASEIRNCKWDDVDFENDTITLWTSKTRDGNPQDDTIEMTAALRVLLESLPQESEYVFSFDGEMIPRPYPFNMMRGVCKRAGVKYFTLHAIRHHVASLLAYKLSLMEISKILRHRNLSTTDVYLRSLVKIETRGIKVLDDINRPAGDNVVPFFRAANGSKK